MNIIIPTDSAAFWTMVGALVALLALMGSACVKIFKILKTRSRNSKHLKKKKEIPNAVVENEEDEKLHIEVNSRYESWDMFMKDVVSTADTLKDLRNIFDLPDNFVQITGKLLSSGWAVFVALVSLLMLSWPAYIMAFGFFIVSPIGILIMVLLGLGSAYLMKLLYKNRQFLISIKKVGESYKPKYDEIISTYSNNKRKLIKYIDELLLEAAKELILQAKIDRKAKTKITVDSK